MLLRLLLILALLALICYIALHVARFFLVRWLKKQIPTPTRGQLQSETLVQCKFCNTFIPITQAIKAKDCYYCSKEHATSTVKDEHKDHES